MIKLKFKIIWVPIALMLLGGAVMIGLTDYITAGFSFKIFRSPEFWSNILCSNIGILCIIISILLIKIDKFQEENEEFLDLKKYMFTYYRNENYKSVVFKKFCAIANRTEKKIVYKTSIQKKYTKLSPTPDDLNIINNGTEEEKKSNKYCIKVEFYEHLMSDEYIENNIDKLKIKYNTLTEDLVFNGVPTTSENVNYITKHKAGKVIKDLLPKYMLSFALTVIMATLVPSFKDGIGIETIFKTATKLFTVCSQIYFAYNYADKYCQEVIMHDIIFRNSVIKDYDLWLAKQIKEVTK